MCSWKVWVALVLCAVLTAQQAVSFTDHSSKKARNGRPLKYSLNPTTRKRTPNVATGPQRSGRVNRKHDVYQTSEDWWREEVTVAERKKLHLEHIMQRILSQTGLNGPVNMSGVVLPSTPMLTHLISTIKSHFEHPAKEMEDVPLGDDPAASIETTFFIAKPGPEWLNLSEDVIYFNLSHQEPSVLSKASVNFWMRPLTLKSTYGTEIRKESHKRKLTKEMKGRKKTKSKLRNGKHGYQQNSTQPKPVTTLVIRKVDLPYVNGMSAKRSERVYTNIKPTSKGRWIRLEVTDMVQEWISDSETNFGITVTTTTTGAQPMVISGLQDDPDKVPVLELEQVKAASDRSKRFANNRVCSTNRESVCCRDELIVDFIDLHWDFIVAPKKYEANLCRGNCPFLYAQQYPHSSLVQKIFNVTDARFGACCGAREMDPLIMIYYDGQAIKVSTIRDMVVKQCGCS